MAISLSNLNTTEESGGSCTERSSSPDNVCNNNSSSSSSPVFQHRKPRGEKTGKRKFPHKNETATTSSNVWVGRCLFLACLVGVAILLCFLAYRLSTDSEKELSERQFDSIAESALSKSAFIADRKLRAAETMALIASYQNPNKDSWPFVSVDGYECMSKNLIEMSSGRGMAFAPFVEPEHFKDFQEWAYDFLETSFPSEKDTVGTFSFGRGIAGSDPSLGASDGKYPADKDGSVRGFESRNRFFAPVIQHNKGAKGPLMSSMRHEPLRGEFMDKMIDCSLDTTSNHGNCGGLTDMIFGQNEPGGMIIKPIYPANETNKLVGVIVSSILWRNTIEGVFSNEVRGIDCVLESDAHVYTYEIVNGIATLKGRGDLHDQKYEEYAKSTILAGNCMTNAKFSANYTLILYPNHELFKVYSTNNPTMFTVGVVAIIIVTSIFFFLYDFCVRQEFNEKRSVLEAKRLFVRYVSHEVRTPLNAASMGTVLIQDEVKRVLNNHDQQQEKTPVDTRMNQKIQPPSLKTQGDIMLPTNDKRVKEEQLQSSLALFANYIQGLLQEVSDNVESAVDILNDLLNYDKILYNSMKLELSDLPILIQCEMIERTVTEFKLSAASKDIHVKLDFKPLVDETSKALDEECPTTTPHANELPGYARQYRVIVDTIRIIQTLRNLLSNAMKFTPEAGRITVTVSLSLYQDNANVPDTEVGSFELSNGGTVSGKKVGILRIQVADTGAGMTPDQLDQLFHDGVQFNVNQLQAGQGSGLGLFITKGILEQHGGSLSAASEGLKRGATFTAKLPIYKTDSKDYVNPSERTATTIDQCGDCATMDPSSSRVSPAPSKKQLLQVEPENLCILVVDDSLINRKLLLRLLKNRGHDCEEAQDGVSKR